MRKAWQSHLIQHSHHAPRRSCSFWCNAVGVCVRQGVSPCDYYSVSSSGDIRCLTHRWLECYAVEVYGCGRQMRREVHWCQGHTFIFLKKSSRDFGLWSSTGVLLVGRCWKLIISRMLAKCMSFFRFFFFLVCSFFFLKDMLLIILLWKASIKPSVFQVWCTSASWFWWKNSGLPGSTVYPLV